MKDPKFGYHWIWMMPVAWTMIAYSKCKNKMHEKAHKRRMQKFLRDNPEAKRMSDLAGIKEP